MSQIAAKHLAAFCPICFCDHLWCVQEDWTPVELTALYIVSCAACCKSVPRDCRVTRSPGVVFNIDCRGIKLQATLY